jgi:mono/diheme cytochrome c family protein
MTQRRLSIQLTGVIGAAILMQPPALHAGGASGVPAARRDVLEAYRAACAACHGVDGRGDGPIAVVIAPFRAPSPRDLSTGTYKLRSTPSGTVPTDEDLLRTITGGIPRYMPGARSLDESLRRGLVQYLKSFSGRFAGPPPRPIDVPEPPALASDAVAKGARTYGELGCPACHGPGGRGDGPAAASLRDSSGRPLWPADLAAPTFFKGGSTPRDVYRTLMTGFDGTPMPGYADALAELEPEAPWNLVAFVASLAR